MDNMIKQADELFNKGDPACISIYEKDDSEYARSKLALIYTEGKCRQRINYEKALWYTKKNSLSFAQALEAHIIAIMKDDKEMANRYFMDLSNKYKSGKCDRQTRKVLSEFYLIGKCTKINFCKALEIYPELNNNKEFTHVFSRLPKASQEKVRIHIENTSDEIGYALIRDFDEYSAKKRTKASDNQSDYFIKIVSLADDKQFKEASALSIQWFKTEKNERSAFTLLRNASRDIDDAMYEDAVRCLKPHLDNTNYARVLLSSSRERNRWDYNEEFLRSPKIITNMHEYDLALLYEHKGHIQYACNHFLKSVKYDRNTKKLDSQSVKALYRAFTLDPKLVKFYPKYASELMNEKDMNCTYAVCSAWIDHECESKKKEGFAALEKIADNHIDSANKLYSLTKDEKYARIKEKLQRKNDGNRYRWKILIEKSTKELEESLNDMPAAMKITALDILSTRYLYGKFDVSKDFQKASDYLIDEIDLCEAYHCSVRYPKAKLGMMMFKKKIPAIDEKLMFNYLYPMKENEQYTYAVAICLIHGRGTEIDMELGTEMLSRSGTEQSLKKLLKIYNNKNSAEYDSDKVFFISRKLLTDFEPQQIVIDAVKELSSKDVDHYPEVSFIEYRNSKIKALNNMGDSCQNVKDSIRYYDFARKLGSQASAIKEANLILKHYDNQRLAYTILKSSNIDQQDYLYSLIQIENENIVDIDSELRSLFAKC